MNTPKNTSIKDNSTESPFTLPESFEYAFAELESIVAQMESGQLSLEKSLFAYKNGNNLLQFCQKSLADIEQQVQILNENNQLVQFKSENE